MFEVTHFTLEKFFSLWIEDRGIGSSQKLGGQHLKIDCTNLFFGSKEVKSSKKLGGQLP